MVVTSCRSASATAMGATSRILNALMTFGIWRGDQDTRSATQLKAQNPIVTGGDRLQTSVQRKRALQRIGSAARRQTKSDRIARQGHLAHMRYERPRFEVSLQVRIFSKIADAGDLDIDRHEIAAGGEQPPIQILHALHALHAP